MGPGETGGDIWPLSVGSASLMAMPGFAPVCVRRRCQNRSANAISATPATPPTTPPAMAPALDLCDEDATAGAVVDSAGADVAAELVAALEEEKKTEEDVELGSALDVGVWPSMNVPLSWL